MLRGNYCRAIWAKTYVFPFPFSDRRSISTNRVDEESWKVGDGVPLGVDERRVGVEDDVAQAVSGQ